MVMVDPVVDPVACWEFDGDILVLHHPTTISAKYQAMGKGWFEVVVLAKWWWLGPLFYKDTEHSLSYHTHVHTHIHAYSSLWQHQTNSLHHLHEQGAPEDRRQGHLSLPIHQESRVHPTRHTHGVQRRKD